MTSPGWYPDPDPSAPQNRLRFWNGSTWTEEVRSADSGSAPPPGPFRDTGGVPVTGPQAQGHQVPVAPLGAHQGDHTRSGYDGAAVQGAYPGYAGQVGPGGQQAPYGGYGPTPDAPPQATHLPDGTALANVWKRLGAQILDSLVLSAAWVVSFVVLVGVFAGIAGGLDPFGTGDGVGLAVLFGYVLQILVMGAVSIWYTILRVRKTGATFGKQWLGLQIRDWHRPGQLTWAQLLTRTLLSNLISSFTFGVYSILDALWCLWDPHRQTLHDKLAGTVVVDHRVPRALPGSAELAVAAASGTPAGWVAQGPEPVSPPGYPYVS